MGGSSKSGKGQGAKDYYADFACIYACGPAQRICAYVVNGDELWGSVYGGTDLSAQANPYVFDIPDRGRVKLYHGTSAQVLADGILNSGTRDHPNMRHLIVAVHEKFLCGRERTTLPDVKLVFVREPQQTVITGTAADVSAYRQANPLAFAAELLTSKVHALGFPDTVCDSVNWQAEADALLAQSLLTYVSPSYSGPFTFVDYMGELSSYLGMWFRVSWEGKIQVGRWPQGVAAPEGIPIVRTEDLKEGTFPDIDPVPQSELKHQFHLSWSDPNKAFEEEHARWNSGLAQSDDMPDSREPGKYDCPWVQLSGQAQHLVARKGRRDSTPYDRITGLEIRESKAREMLPGDLFVLSLDRDGVVYFKFCHLLSVEGWGDGDAGFVSCEAEESTGVYPTPEWLDLAEQELEADPVPEDVTYWDVLQAPKIMAGDRYRFFVLAERNSGLADGFNVHFRSESEDWQFVGQQRTWAVGVELEAGIDGDDLSIPLSLLSDPDVSGFSDLPSAPTEDEVLDDYLLLILIDPADPRLFEAFSVSDFGDPVDGVYPMSAIRARQGTVARSFATGARGYLTRREGLRFYTHSQIAELGKLPVAEDREVDFAVQPFMFRATLDLEEATPRTVEIVEAEIADPTNFQVIGLDGGFTLQFGVSEPDIIGARIWSAPSVEQKTEEPTFVYAISVREIQAGIVRIPYFEPEFQDGSPFYFWLQTFDDALLTNYSNVIGPITNRAFAIDGQGPSVEIVQSPDPASRPIPGPGKTFTLTAIVKNYYEAITYQWYRYPIDAPDGTMQLLAGQTAATLTVPHEDIIPSPSNSSPSASRKYRVVVNGYQWDEHTIQLGRPQEGDNRFWLRDEITTVYFNEDLTLRDSGDIVNRVLGISSNFKISTDQWASVEAEAQDPAIGLGGPLKDHVFHLVLPPELQFLPSFLVPNSDPKVRFSSVRLTALGKAALNGDLDDVSFPITVHAQYRLGDIDSAQVEDTVVLNWIVKKNVVVQETPTITMATTAPPIFEQPIAPTIFYVSATFRRSFYEVWSTIARYSVDADGIITRLLTSYGIGPAIYDALGLENGLGAPASFFDGYYRAASGAPPAMSAEGDGTGRVVVTATRSGAAPVSLILQAEPDVAPPFTNADWVGFVYNYSDTPSNLSDNSEWVGSVGLS